MYNKNISFFKKIISVALSLFLVCFFASCGEDKEDPNNIGAGMTVEEKIVNSTLLYPSFNENFKYDVYDYYVTVTSYIGNSEDVVIPDKIDGREVLYIGPGAFAKDYENEEYTGPKVKSIKLPSCLVVISESAFAGSLYLKDISLPTSLIQINDSAFENCISLKEIKIPKSVDLIGNNAFFGCTSLVSVTIEQQILRDELGEVSLTENNENGRSIGDSCFGGCTNLAAAWVPADILYVGDSAFVLEDSPNLVIYGDGQTRIAYYASEYLLKFNVLNKSKFDELAKQIVDSIPDATVPIETDKEGNPIPTEETSATTINTTSVTAQ